MHKSLEYIIDILFPPSKDEMLVRQLRNVDISLLLHPTQRDTVITLTEFKNPYIRALIHETKFHDSETAQKLLGALLDAHLISVHITYDMIIPVPLSPKRMRERGYNQVTEVIRQSICAKKLKEGVLKRTRNTAPQTSLDRVSRLTNMKDAFIVQDRALVQGKNILLVDDVLTTGATLHAAQSTLLLHAPASITCLAFAH